MGGAVSLDKKSIQKYNAVHQMPFHLGSRTRLGEDKYICKQIIGTGEQSTVFAGQNTKDKSQVAVKKIISKNISTQRTNRITKEIQILRAVSKLPDSEKHFVSFVEAFKDQDENIFIVTKHIPGCELFEIVKSKSKGLEERVVRKMLYQIFQGINILHQNDIAHGDIKLENIMYDSENKCMKLIDFGFSTKTSNVNENGEKEKKLSTTFCGSIHYVSPEIIDKIPFHPKKADIWSLGILAYILLFGKFPFFHESNFIVQQKIKEGTYTLPNHISDEGKELLGLMLKTNPSSRPSIESLLCHPWWKIDL